MKQILLIEDEKNLALFIEMELKHEFFAVTKAFDGRTGLELALAKDWDLILLDIMLPELNGIEVCRRIREVKTTPIIMLTARDSVADRVSGLDSGADDYIPKPFAIEELLARIRSLNRRLDMTVEQERETICHRNITIELDARLVKLRGEVVELTKREFDLLVMLMRNLNIVLSRDVLMERIWGHDSEVETNVVDVYVRYLRNKLDEPGQESMIQTVRGVGYVMR
ncbi:PhoB family transcriptional regulator [Gordoniibacillus kamchatkensis]|uniref:PhoB family transcriptional regulator n=1 Tax=Gordoniibacillus kamchatkensis TaxID=1590651 RepID=A0ABR5AAS0_9BACL|nr:response regulator transcription factor [Paenibacillus sp. VKM B-2647]KIL38119.1 PhoB family transcriptional regulator [Paenibacillus sp. VKM B-2647]